MWDKLIQKKACFKTLLLITSLSLVWIFQAVPLLLYHLSRQADSIAPKNETQRHRNMTCSNYMYYKDGICFHALKEIHASLNCSIGSNGLLVRENSESVISILMSTVLSESTSKCREKALPFMCLYLFGLCIDEASIEPTVLECEEIRNLLCRREWKLISKNGFEDWLPDCSQLPIRRYPKCSRSKNISGPVPRESFENQMNSTECSENFFQSNSSGLCVPNCYSWSQYGHKISLTINVLVIIFSLLGFLLAVLFILASLYRHRSMFHFPAILIIYMNLDILILACTFAAPYIIGRNHLFCSSVDLLESITNVTPFCIASGMINTYVIFQLSIWWLMHMIFLTYTIKYPFRAQTLLMSGRKRKLLHMICAVVGMLLPISPILASVVDYAINEEKTIRGYGFGAPDYPPIICTALNHDVTYYASILPLGVVLGLGGSLLVWCVWLIDKARESKKHFDTAEKKLLIILSYYFIITVVAQITLTDALIEAPKFKDAFQKYLLCEQSSPKPNSPCDRSAIEHYGNPLAALLPFLAVELLPAVLLLFVVNVEDVKKKWFRAKSRKGLSANSTNLSLDL